MKKALGAVGATLVAAVCMALPASAAAEQFCYGTVKAIEATEDGAVPAQYAFACREPIAGFAIQTSRQLTSFGVTADVFEADKTTLSTFDRMECDGEFPSNSFSCNGIYSGFSRFITGEFEPTDGACQRSKATNKLMLRTLVVVASPRGRVSTYGLGKPKECPEGTPAPAASPDAKVSPGTMVAPAKPKSRA